ncbi:hypothetical protein WV31_12945 [Magnetospirillum sp. ME-1]|nr:hypothetical protein WV31_12945 [Magnetospirillum sp. ME-1]
MAKRVIRAALSAVGWLVVPFWLGALWLIEPFHKLRFIWLLDGRIGHLAMDTDLFLRRFALNGKPARSTLIFLATNPCNRQLVMMFARKNPTVVSPWLEWMFATLREFLARTRFFIPVISKSDEHREFSLTAPSLSFLPEEERRGRSELERMGVGASDWFVCLHTRDQAYLQSMGYPTESGGANDHRNCSIENYLPAADYIAKQGGYVLRLGAKVERPLPEGLDPRIIDYATHFRSDFMDIYLPAHCRFYFGCDSGIAQVPQIFNKYHGLANYVPYCFVPMGRYARYIPKLLYPLAGDQPLPFRRAADMGLFHNKPEQGRSMNQYLHDHGLEWRENLPEDILDFALDMIDFCNGTEVPLEAQRLQQLYAMFYQGTKNYSEYSPSIGPRFALKYRRLIES